MRNLDIADSREKLSVYRRVGAIAAGDDLGVLEGGD
jgi:hypothetical protein